MSKNSQLVGKKSKTVSIHYAMKGEIIQIGGEVLITFLGSIFRENYEKTLESHNRNNLSKL